MSTRFMIAAVALLLAAGIAPLVGCDLTPQAPRRTPFPHSAHLSSKVCGAPGLPTCPTCVSCHRRIAESEAQALPDISVCTGCHGAHSKLVQAQRAAWAQGVRRSRTIGFEHRQHQGQECLECHAGIEHDSAGPDAFPAKPDCLPCHSREISEGECGPCHRRADLAQRVPQSFLRHDPEFVRSHGPAAAGKDKVCRACHAQAFCSDCHSTDQTLPIEARQPERLDRSFGHRADFVTRHASEARSQGASCLRCHAPASCDGCHVERGVSAARADGSNPHPIGWIGPNITSPDFHGRSARRNVLSCAGCHDHGPATNCIRCHKVGGLGGNPHPSGWTSSRSPQDSMCRYCHGS